MSGFSSGISVGLLTCHMTFTREDHSDTMYSQLKVFIPADWDHTQVFMDQGMVREHPEHVFFFFFQGKNFTLASCSELQGEDRGRVGWGGVGLGDFTEEEVQSKQL